MRQRLGPGLLITAAFVGPGTIATASSAGAHYGFALCWALLFSVLATAVLQEMAARQSLVTRRSLAANLRLAARSQLLGHFMLVLVIAAIGFGNAAYEAGNLSGAALALASIGALDAQLWALLIAVAAGWLLWFGGYRRLEQVLIGLVLLMSAVFLLCALLLLPTAELAVGLLRPALPAGSLLTAIALIGTTVVPYNLFLHASAVTSKWSEALPLDQTLRAARWDSAVSISLGGLITLAIMSTAAVTFFAQGLAFDGMHMATQLQAVLGAASEPVFATGLFASGLSSALTAPVAAGFAVSGALGRPASMQDARVRQ